MSGISLHEDPPTIEACRELLEPHRKRPIRAFLRAPDPGNHSDSRVFDAFWDVVYHETPACSHAVARAVEAELVHSERSVGELLEGWRPAALAERAS